MVRRSGAFLAVLPAVLLCWAASLPAQSAPRITTPKEALGFNTGKLPLQVPTVMALFAKVLSEDPPRPSTLVDGASAALDGLVLQLLANRPEDRVPSAGVLLRRWQALAWGLGAFSTGSALASLGIGWPVVAGAGTITGKPATFTGRVSAAPAKVPRIPSLLGEAAQGGPRCRGVGRVQPCARLQRRPREVLA